MKKLYFNYVAMGEAVMEWVVNAYVNAVQTINCVGAYNEVSKEAWKTIETIDMKIEQEKVYDFLPHVALDKSLFLDELRGFADKYKNEPNPVPADGYVTRKVWEKLPMTKEREEELENENAELREELKYYKNRKLSGRQKHNAKWMAIYNDFVVGYENGMTMVEIAKRNHVSERTIYRYKAYYEKMREEKHGEE